MAGRRQVTLRQVAERAGVSISTASLVFSRKGPVAAGTADRVRRAAAELGYAGPDPLASSLRQGRAGVVGVLVEGRLLHAFRDPFAVSVLDGLSQVLDRIPAGMLLVAQDASDPGSVVDHLSSLALDAVVFSLCGPVENPAVEHLAARGIPMVATGTPESPDVTQLRVADREATAEITRYLREIGHARIGMVTMPMTPRQPTGWLTPTLLEDAIYRDSRDRALGFRRILGARAPVVVAGESDVAQGQRAAGLLLDLPPAVRPTAVVAQSDLLAAGVVRAAQDRGLSVPRDLSVTGFDGVSLPWLPVTLTTIDQHGERKGRRLGEMVRERLAGAPVADEVAPTDLRVGTSTGPPPA